MVSLSVWAVEPGKSVEDAEQLGSFNFEKVPRQGEVVRLKGMVNYEVLSILHHPQDGQPAKTSMFLQRIPPGVLPNYPKN